AGFDDANGYGRPEIAYGAKGNGDPISGGWFAWWEQPEDAKSRQSRFTSSRAKRSSTSGSVFSSNIPVPTPTSR
ncbi:MAG: hypothetical protein L7V87_09585, partial [Verrucomicrobiales bacterium]|nr:hypothetical protein [Verrucomicrobiales bacterium]